MDKRKKENIRVKKEITDALFSLMAEKSLADIHITEIVHKAGVARISFYRNYSSKEDILITLIRDVLDEFRVEMCPDPFYTYENVLLSFRYFQKYREYILDLQRCGFSSVLMEELNHFHESIEGTMPFSSVKKYELYMYIGALMNTGTTWLSDEKTSAEEIARFFIDRILKMRGCEDGQP